jgi:hypothetical protein
LIFVGFFLPLGLAFSIITTPDFIQLPDGVYFQNDNATGQGLLALAFCDSGSCHRNIVATRSDLLWELERVRIWGRSSSRLDNYGAWDNGKK